MAKHALKRRGRIMIIAAGLIVVALVAVGGRLVLRDPADQEAARSTTATVATTTLEQTISTSGTVAAAESAEESFEVSGTVTEVLVEAGDSVSAGDELAVVDDTVPAAELTAAEASYEAAQEAVDEADTDATEAAATT